MLVWYICVCVCVCVCLHVRGTGHGWCWYGVRWHGAVPNQLQVMPTSLWLKFAAFFEFELLFSYAPTLDGMDM